MTDDRVNAILKSIDVPRTIDWYKRLGFEERGRYPENDPTWCELARDDVVLQFLGGETPWEGPPSFTGTLYVHPESVNDLYDQMKDRIEPAWGPEVREWGLASWASSTRTDTSSRSPNQTGDPNVPHASRSTFPAPRTPLNG